MRTSSSEYQAVAQSAPPPLPSYDQPPIPGPGYVWTPGYWDWSDDANDYYWVPGTWVQPPQPGVLWTPGYWRYYNGHYLYSDGYLGSGGRLLRRRRLRLRLRERQRL